MDLFFPLLSSMFLFVVVGANHATLDPQMIYWRTILPHTPMPSAIEQLLKPDVYVDEKSATSVDVGKSGVDVNTGKGTTVNVGHSGVGVNTGISKPTGTTVGVGKGGVNVHTGKGTAVNVGKGGVVVGVHPGPNGKPGGTTVNVGKGGVGVATNHKGKPVYVNVNPKGTPFNYIYAASETQLHDNPADALFFLRQDLRPGKQFPLQLSGGNRSPSFIPRLESNAIPFSTSELPSILSRYSIPAGSVEAAAMAATLSECEAAPAEKETKRCATSLESMVDFVTESLGTNEIVAVETEGGEVKRRYRVEAVRKVAAAWGKGVVACHVESYVYAVFFCHASRATEVYEVDMVADGSGEAAKAKAVAVCHTDTAGWNPKHLAFRVLKVKPGTVPVCHFLPQDHVVWASIV